MDEDERLFVIQAAIDLGYSAKVIALLKAAKTANERARIMATARNAE